MTTATDIKMTADAATETLVPLSGVLPNFLIIGAAKAGTTSLAAYLQQHPDIFLSRLKEPNYFALNESRLSPKGPVPREVLMHLLYNWSALDRDSYLALFAEAASFRARGEASVRYLYFDCAAVNIHRSIPDVRLIVILRNPAERIYSHFNMNVQKQLEPLDLLDALEAEPDRMAAGWGWDWHYASASRYAPQLKRYFDLFGREAVSVHLYDDFVRAPLQTISAICRHIGVDDGFEPDMRSRGKIAYRPRSSTVDRLCNWPHPVKTALYRAGLGRVMTPVLQRISKLNYVPAPRLSQDLRKAVSGRFRSDNSDLADLLGKETGW